MARMCSPGRCSVSESMAVNRRRSSSASPPGSEKRKADSARTASMKGRLPHNNASAARPRRVACSKDRSPMLMWESGKCVWKNCEVCLVDSQFDLACHKHGLDVPPVFPTNSKLRGRRSSGSGRSRSIGEFTVSAALRSFHKRPLTRRRGPLNSHRTHRNCLVRARRPDATMTAASAIRQCRDVAQCARDITQARSTSAIALTDR
jgi:hypothetical protein